MAGAFLEGEVGMVEKKFSHQFRKKGTIQTELLKDDFGGLAWFYKGVFELGSNFERNCTPEDLEEYKQSLYKFILKNI